MKTAVCLWTLLSAGPAVLPDSARGANEDVVGAVLSFRREQIDVRVPVGETSLKRVRLDSVGTEPFVLTGAEGDHPSLSVALVHDGKIHPADAEQPWDHAVPPESSAHLHLTVAAADLAEGDHRFQLSVYGSDREKPALTVPVAIRVLEERGKVDPDDWSSADLPKPMQTEGPPPRIEFDQYVHDFESRLQGETLTHRFTFHNRGEGVLYIQDYRTQCHCSVASIVLPDGPVSKNSPSRSNMMLRIRRSMSSV